MQAFPDTTLVREALPMAREVLSPATLNHSLRAFQLGAAYGARKGRDFDAEALAIAALFHDFGLFAPHRDRRRPFVDASSGALSEFLGAREVPADRSRVMAEAIELHMKMAPPWKAGNVAGLLQVGAWMDITFLRRWAIRSEAREIARALPRIGIDLEFPRNLIGAIGSVSACTGLMVRR